jgi:hypothetical protein
VEREDAVELVGADVAEIGTWYRTALELRTGRLLKRDGHLATIDVGKVVTDATQTIDRVRAAVKMEKLSMGTFARCKSAGESRHAGRIF